jgi:putative modified peptide
MDKNKVELTVNAVKLLQKLGTDDGVRAALVSDPVGTLAGYGLQLDPALAPNSITLPSKEAFQDAFGQHVDWFSDPAAQMAFIFTVFFSGNSGSSGGQGGNG